MDNHFSDVIAFLMFFVVVGVLTAACNWATRTPFSRGKIAVGEVLKPKPTRTIWRKKGDQK